LLVHHSAGLSPLSDSSGAHIIESELMEKVLLLEKEETEEVEKPGVWL